MSRRTYLLLAAVANCWSTVQLSGIIYTLSKGLYPDFTYDVCCFYNGSAQKPWDIQLSLENQRLQAALIDESSIRYRVSKSLIRRKSLEFSCLWPDNSSTNFTIEESTFLRPYKFSCLYTDIEMELKCQFDHPVEETETTPFILIMDNTFKVECVDLYGELPECILEYPIHFRGVSRNFTFELHSHGIVRKLMFNLPDIQMRTPYWPINKPHIEQLNLAACLDFGSQAFKNTSSYEWEVCLMTHNPMMTDNILANIITYKDAGFQDTKDVCFEIPSYHYQTYDLLLKIRFNHSDAPWTRYNYQVKFTTKATNPKNPPNFMSNGFFYDSKNNRLHVFWWKLPKLEFNGPNFTYFLLTDEGKKPFIKGNSSAVFHDWDPTQSAVVSIWSQNSMGQSLESSNLTVPILINRFLYQVQNLRYHLENHTLTWDAPQKKNMLETFLIYCCSAAENSNQLCDDLDQINFQSVTKWTYHYKFQKSKGHLMGVAAKYSDDSGGGIKWYVEPSIPQGKEANSLNIGIILPVAGLLVFGLLGLIFFSFRKWKRRKTKEIKISLPPIFDPIVMERLRLRNVEFPQSRNPPDEGISLTRVPSRIFLDSMETEKIVALSTQLNKSNDPPDPDSSPYTEMDIVKKPDSFTYAQQK